MRSLWNFGAVRVGVVVDGGRFRVCGGGDGGGGGAVVLCGDPVRAAG